MDGSVAVNLAALILSAVSLAVAATLARRQTWVMNQANQLPVLVELSREGRSEEFMRSEDYILHRLASEHSASLGESRLPEEARRAVSAVVSIYNTLGGLVATNVANEAPVILLFGQRANRVWMALEPHILGERKLRGGSYYAPYAAFFEDLVWRFRERGGPKAGKSYKVRLNRLCNAESIPNRLQSETNDPQRDAGTPAEGSDNERQ